ncbi:MAG: hypothetical protein ISQ31_08215 [Alphaproteobacteria bacterium]|nr:hypothetical protein [Alphaproteobacteria bacterium]
MKNFNLVKFAAPLTFALFSLSHNAHAAPANYTMALNVCTGGAAVAYSGSAPYCRMTPGKYEVTVYEMGFCTSHPFDDGAESAGAAAMDKSTCTTIFTNTAGSRIDIAATIGATSKLEGTATRPADGTYRYPYMVMSNQFTVSGSMLGVPGTAQASTTYYTDSTGTPNTSAAEDYSYTLNNLGPGTGGSAGCYSGSIDQTGTAGTIDAYLTNNALTRRDSTDTQSSGGVTSCAGATRLIGVMDLTTAFTVTPNTSQVLFTFDVTDQGLRVMADKSGSTGAVIAIESGPFSGNFSVVNID